MKKFESQGAYRLYCKYSLGIDGDILARGELRVWVSGWKNWKQNVRLCLDKLNPESSIWVRNANVKAPVRKRRVKVLQLDMIIASPQGRLIDYSGMSMSGSYIQVQRGKEPGIHGRWIRMRQTGNACEKSVRGIRSRWLTKCSSIQPRRESDQAGRRDLSMAMS